MKYPLSALAILILWYVNLAFTMSTNCKYQYWEDLSSEERTQFLSSEDLSKDAISYLQNQFTITNLERTEYLIIEIIGSDSINIPPYHYIFNDLCLQSDSALSELMSYYILDYFKAHTKYIINYFSCKNLSQSKLYESDISLIAKAISSEDNAEKSVEDLARYLMEKLQNASPDDQKTAETIIDDINKSIKKF